MTRNRGKVALVICNKFIACHLMEKEFCPKHVCFWTFPLETSTVKFWLRLSFQLSLVEQITSVSKVRHSAKEKKLWNDITNIVQMLSKEEEKSRSIRE